MHVIAETSSTNDDVKAMARAGAGEGLWVRADRQTSGRGRLGRNWVSPAGNLYASTLVEIRENDPPPPTLAFVAAIALLETFTTYLPDADLRLKWPNDVLANGAKISGILLEREGNKIIVGIGANLAVTPDIEGRELTSIARLGGMIPDPQSFLDILASRLTVWIDGWRTYGLSVIRDRWMEKALPLGTMLTVVEAEGSSLSGKFDGLDADCAMRLRLADGAIRAIHAGDVFLTTGE